MYAPEIATHSSENNETLHADDTRLSIAFALSVLIAKQRTTTFKSLTLIKIYEK
jgi:hypothetical protein